MPKFVKKPENVECIEFDDVKFETTVSGKPEPTVEWYFFSLCMTSSFYPSVSLYKVCQKSQFASQN